MQHAGLQGDCRFAADTLYRLPNEAQYLLARGGCCREEIRVPKGVWMHDGQGARLCDLAQHLRHVSKPDVQLEDDAQGHHYHSLPQSMLHSQDNQYMAQHSEVKMTTFARLPLLHHEGCHQAHMLPRTLSSQVRERLAN
jgi:hypothetical protein